MTPVKGLFDPPREVMTHRLKTTGPEPGLQKQKSVASATVLIAVFFVYLFSSRYSGRAQRSRDFMMAI